MHPGYLAEMQNISINIGKICTDFPVSFKAKHLESIIDILKISEISTEGRSRLLGKFHQIY
jgi:hypothetical protein